MYLELDEQGLCRELEAAHDGLLHTPSVDQGHTWVGLVAREKGITGHYRQSKIKRRKQTNIDQTGNVSVYCRGFINTHT